MTQYELLPHVSALSEYGFNLCFDYLMLAAKEHGIKSLVIPDCTQFWALTKEIEPPALHPGADPAFGIEYGCTASKTLQHILQDKNCIAFHAKLLSPGGKHLYVHVQVEAQGKFLEFDTLNDFFNWLGCSQAPEELPASAASRLVRQLFRAKGMGFFVADPVRQKGVAFHHDLADTVDFNGPNTYKANFYGTCDLKTKIEADDYEFKEYLDSLE